MSIYIRDAATDKAVRKLARLRGVSLTETIRDLAEKALVEETAKRNQKEEQFRLQRLRELQDEFAKYPPTGLKADKAFYDWLSGEED